MFVHPITCFIMKNPLPLHSCLFLCIGAVLFSTATAARAEMPAMAAISTVKAAIAVLQPTAGNDVKGVIRFTQVEGGVRVVADVTGLKPGEHGFHIHQYGDITAPDGMSAGGHLNPAHKNHGAPASPERHEGDLGNLKADANGHATLDVIDPVIMLNGPTSILGRGVIVHADADDLKSQPVGNAGKRVAAGVIGVAKGE